MIGHYRIRRILTGSAPTPGFPNPDHFEIYEIGPITDKTLMDGVFNDLRPACEFIINEYPRVYVTQEGREPVRVANSQELQAVLMSGEFDLSFGCEKTVVIRPSTDRDDVTYYPNRQAYAEKIRRAKEEVIE